MEALLVLVLLAVLLTAGMVTGSVLLTRRVVRVVQASPAVRRAGELGGYLGTAVAVARHPGRTDRTAAVLAARVTTASVGLRREVALATRAGAHLGDVPAVLPGLTDEAFALSRELRRLTTCTVGPAGTDLCAAARTHLTAVAEVTAAVRASTALPAAVDGVTGGVTAEASRVAADLRAYAGAYRDLIRPVSPS